MIIEKFRNIGKISALVCFSQAHLHTYERQHGAPTGAKKVVRFWKLQK